MKHKYFILSISAGLTALAVAQTKILSATDWCESSKRKKKVWTEAPWG